MKLLKLMIIFFSLLLFSCNKKLNDIPKISKGKVTENWLYSNETMKFKLQLPQDWNFVDNSNGISNFIIMNEIAPKNILGNEKITISKTFHFSDESSIYPLFSISKNTLENIRSGNREGDLSFAVISSENGNAEEDIADVKKNLFSQLKDKPQTLKLNEQNLKNRNEVFFGNKNKIPYFQFTVPDMEGNATGNRIYAFKNYGNYNLVILITYFDDEELAFVKELMKSITN